MGIAAETFLEKITNNLMMRRVAAARSSGGQANFLPYYLEHCPSGSDETIVNGTKYILLGSSNYLGLAQDERVKQAAKDAVDAFGTSCTSSRLLCGSRALHRELEAEMADFIGTEAVLVFSTGYMANLGTIPALVGRHDEAFFDAQVHACIIDGIMLSGASRSRFRHNDMAHLEQKLARSTSERKLVLVDSLYSLTGDIAPVDTLVDLCRTHDAWLFLDDAHGLGVLGPQGRGLAAKFGLADQVQVTMGVFSKSFASVGGFIGGSAALVDTLRFNARSYLYSNALPPANAAAALASLRICQKEPERAKKAIANAETARVLFRQFGYECGGDGTQMVPVILRDENLTLEVTKALAEEGVWVSPALYPGVPQGCDLLRICFPPTMSDSSLMMVFVAFERTANRFKEEVMRVRNAEDNKPDEDE